MISLHIVQIKIDLTKDDFIPNEGTQISMPVGLKWSLYLTPCHKLFKYVHARNGDNVSENSTEGVKNINVDKIMWRKKF